MLGRFHELDTVNCTADDGMFVSEDGLLNLSCKREKQGTWKSEN